MNNRVNLLLGIAFGVLSHWVLATANTKEPVAPGYQPLKFNAPLPGSYELSNLGRAADGNLLDSEGRNLTLHSLIGDRRHPGKITVLSFIYTTCSDVNGCPLAMAVFHKLKGKLAAQPDIATKIRLLTVSFNPEYDTPARMKEFGKNLQGPELDWRFLTLSEPGNASGILKAYGQNVEKVYDAQGRFTNTFNHALRVYLIDANGEIRNIYNTELLHPDMLLTDIKTLLSKQSASATTTKGGQALFIAGDDKRGYDNIDYQTRSISLKQRQGNSSDLMSTIRRPPLGLTPVPIPTDNPITLDKIKLGRKLFYDRRLSYNGTFSCAMCHVPEQGFTSNEMATAVGVEGRSVRRNSPTLYNVAYQRALFHDGRESTLEQQAWSPLLAHNEMANPSIGFVIDVLANNSDYDGLFAKAFGKPPGMETIGMALASYERTLNSANSPFDRWHFGKGNKFPETAQQGYILFIGKAGCSQCHTIAKNFALFTDHSMHNTGIGYATAMSRGSVTANRVQVSPGVFVEVPKETIATVAETPPNDLGRYEITQNPKDRWLYKTPTLRNVALTAPYMHDGSIASLKEVVEFYNRGGISNENLDPLIKPLNLNDKEITQLVTFLENLTGDNTDTLIADAYAAPVGDKR